MERLNGFLFAVETSENQGAGDNSLLGVTGSPATIRGATAVRGLWDITTISVLSGP